MTAPQQQGMSIGTVLEILRPNFPDITISKIRFLEAEGLVTPERTPSGYRRFSAADCDRLRFVLSAQRDQYLPLKVIKEQLEAIDSGVASLGAAQHQARSPRRLGLVAPEEFRASEPTRLSRKDLLAKANCEDTFLSELIKSGLVVPSKSGYFDDSAVTLIETAKAMCEFGLEVRHLRAYRLAADREAALIAQVAGPVANRKDVGARDRAQELASELAALSLTLHTCLVKSAVSSVLDR
ncbi:MAG: MerR family transcriptional regulator [Nocardiaceae bacterium]|nr:MerR family transcriptional regulator [Nocardiaceae bacterium]